MLGCFWSIFAHSGSWVLSSNIIDLMALVLNSCSLLLCLSAAFQCSFFQPLIRISQCQLPAEYFLCLVILHSLHCFRLHFVSLSQSTNGESVKEVYTGQYATLYAVVDCWFYVIPEATMQTLVADYKFHFLQSYIFFLSYGYGSSSTAISGGELAMMWIAVILIFLLIPRLNHYVILASTIYRNVYKYINRRTLKIFCYSFDLIFVNIYMQANDAKLYKYCEMSCKYCKICDKPCGPLYLPRNSANCCFYILFWKNDL